MKDENSKTKTTQKKEQNKPFIIDFNIASREEKRQIVSIMGMRGIPARGNDNGAY